MLERPVNSTRQLWYISAMKLRDIVNGVTVRDRATGKTYFISDVNQIGVERRSFIETSDSTFREVFAETPFYRANRIPDDTIVARFSCDSQTCWDSSTDVDIHIYQFVSGDRDSYKRYIEYHNNNRNDRSFKILCVDVADLEDVSTPYLPAKNKLKFGKLKEFDIEPGDNINLKSGAIVYGSPPALNIKMLKTVHRVSEDDIAEFTGEYAFGKLSMNRRESVYAIRVKSAYGDWEGWVQTSAVKRDGLSLTVPELVCHILAVDGPSSTEHLNTRFRELSGRDHEINDNYFQPHASNKDGMLGKFIEQDQEGDFYLTSQGESLAFSVTDRLR